MTSLAERAAARLRRALAPEARPVPGSPAPGGLPVYVGEGRVLAHHPAVGHQYLDGRCLTVTPLAVQGAYEPAITVFLQRWVQPGDVVVEVGANQGYHTLTAAVAVGTAGRVVAVEPHPRTVRLLWDNVLSNGLIGRVDVVEAAAWEVDGTTTFYARVGQSAGSFVRDAVDVAADFADPDGSQDLQVRTVDLRALLEAQPRVPALVKIDAEGSEARLLRHVGPYLERHHPTLLMEVLPGVMGEGQPAQLEGWLRELGYAVAAIDPGGVLRVLGPGAFGRVHDVQDLLITTTTTGRAWG